jgi:hypothetical protein
LIVDGRIRVQSQSRIRTNIVDGKIRVQSQIWIRTNIVDGRDPGSEPDPDPYK